MDGQESKKHIKKAAPEEAVDMLTPKFRKCSLV
jgi:hypothetical protein